MPDIKSIAAIKEAIGGENFDNNINVVVTDEKTTSSMFIKTYM